MKILVTGASGFIGSRLVNSLVAAGEHVRVLVRSSSDLSGIAPQVERYVGDLANDQSTRGALFGVKRVFHCGALVADWGSPEQFHAVNVMGTNRLAEAALKGGVERFVHISTTDVYGHPCIAVAEDAPFRYRGWPYGDTKIDAEKALLEIASQGLPTTIIRPATVYGPRAPIVKGLAHLLTTGEMMFIGDGSADAGLCYVDNVVDAVRLAGEKDVAVGRVYNVVDSLGVTWRTFTNSLAKALGLPKVHKHIPYRLAYGAAWLLESWGKMRKQLKRPLLTRMAVEILGTNQHFSTDRISHELGWSPRVTFEEGMDRITAELQQQRNCNT